MAEVELGLLEEAVVRHDRARHHRARIAQVVAVPVVGIFAADAGEIGPGALGAPLERPVVHALGRERVMAVAFDLVAQRTDHLRMAEIAAFAHIDVAAGELERRIGPHTVDLFDRVLEVEQRHDLDQAADRDHDQDADEENDRVLLEDCVFVPERHCQSPPYSAATSRGAGSATSAAFTVFQRFHTISSAPERNRMPPSARMT